jgi:hypothetical protein
MVALLGSPFFDLVDSRKKKNEKGLLPKNGEEGASK